MSLATWACTLGCVRSPAVVVDCFCLYSLYHFPRLICASHSMSAAVTVQYCLQSWSSSSAAPWANAYPRCFFTLSWVHLLYILQCRWLYCSLAREPYRPRYQDPATPTRLPRSLAAPLHPPRTATAARPSLRHRLYRQVSWHC